MQSETHKLQPCPFCGGPAKIISCMGDWLPESGYEPCGRRVVCAVEPVGCASGKPFYGDGMEAAAVAWWNTRALTPPAGGEAVADGIDSPHNACCYRESCRANAAEIARLRAELAKVEGAGWLYHNPDTGVEFSDNHPVDSGEVEDATHIKRATAENLLPELLEAWSQFDQLHARAEAAEARALALEARVEEMEEAPDATEALRVARDYVIDALNERQEELIKVGAYPKLVQREEARVKAIKDDIALIDAALQPKEQTS